MKKLSQNIGFNGLKGKERRLEKIYTLDWVAYVAMSLETTMTIQAMSPEPQKGKNGCEQMEICSQ
jgi:hypothetical protein